MPKKQILAFIVASVVSLLLGVLILRSFAPQLLGVPVDLQMVQVAEEVPPFFSGVFRAEDFDSESFIVKDPFVTRARPLLIDGALWGPHDLLGLRNSSIPVVADVVTIGDSMTYGMGVVHDESWPIQLEGLLEDKAAVVYNMALGGWSATEYLQMVPHALRFRPRVLVVAFYTGNDPREALTRVYSKPELEDLRLDSEVHPGQLPPLKYPPPEDEWWSAEFEDGYKTIFTPQLRAGSNLDHPAIRAAYSIMAEVARRIAAMTAAAGAETIFTVLPTKALALSAKVAQDGLDAPEAYQALVRDESLLVRDFLDELRAIENATVVDIVPVWQTAALGGSVLFREDIDGHPHTEGHSLIAREIAPPVDRALPAPLDGAVRVVYEEDEKRWVYSKGIFIRGDGKRLFRYLLVRDQLVYRFRSEAIFEANGWSVDELPDVRPRDIANLPHGGTIETTDRQAYGPR